MGWAGIGMVALGFTAKEYKSGRMIIVGASSIGDSNDYAAQIMFILPVIAYVLFVAKKSIVRRLLGLVAIPAGFYQLLSTGSRGALVSACLTMLLILFISRPKMKIALLLGIPAVALLAIPFVPSQAADRLASLFQSSDDKTGEAAESAEARRRLLSQSIKLSLSNPLFGVGPGQFMDSEGAIAKEAGQRGMWHETHNTYTQVSSECGIPALLCFVSALGFTLRRLWKARKSDDRMLAGVAQVIFVSTFGFCICVFFLSHAYGFAFLISTALAISIDRLLAERAATTSEETADSGLAPASPSRPVPLHA
jgi:O-antigen ligase